MTLTNGSSECCRSADSSDEEKHDDALGTFDVNFCSAEDSLYLNFMISVASSGWMMMMMCFICSCRNNNFLPLYTQ
jgi:hypothetical protein